MRINNFTKIEKLIQISVEKLNLLLRNSSQNIELNDNLNNFSLKPSKKSGKPNLDLPSKNSINLLEIDNKCYVFETEINTFSLIFNYNPIVNKTSSPHANKCYDCRKCAIF